MKQLTFLHKPSDMPNIERIIFAGQKCYHCLLCGVWGPWWDRVSHKCEVWGNENK